MNDYIFQMYGHETNTWQAGCVFLHQWLSEIVIKDQHCLWQHALFVWQQELNHHTALGSTDPHRDAAAAFSSLTSLCVVCWSQSCCSVSFTLTWYLLWILIRLMPSGTRGSGDAMTEDATCVLVCVCLRVCVLFLTYKHVWDRVGWVSSTSDKPEPIRKQGRHGYWSPKCSQHTNTVTETFLFFLHLSSKMSSLWFSIGWRRLFLWFLCRTGGGETSRPSAADVTAWNKNGKNEERMWRGGIIQGDISSCFLSL